MVTQTQPGAKNEWVTVDLTAKVDTAPSRGFIRKVANLLKMAKGGIKVRGSFGKRTRRDISAVAQVVPLGMLPIDEPLPSRHAHPGSRRTLACNFFYTA